MNENTRKAIEAVLEGRSPSDVVDSVVEADLEARGGLSEDGVDEVSFNLERELFGLLDNIAEVSGKVVRMSLKLKREPDIERDDRNAFAGLEGAADDFLKTAKDVIGWIAHKYCR